jgi:hypothetical protein
MYSQKLWNNLQYLVVNAVSNRGSVRFHEKKNASARTKPMNKVIISNFFKKPIDHCMKNA